MATRVANYYWQLLAATAAVVAAYLVSTGDCLPMYKPKDLTALQEKINVPRPTFLDTNCLNAVTASSDRGVQKSPCLDQSSDNDNSNDNLLKKLWNFVWGTDKTKEDLTRRRFILASEFELVRSNQYVVNLEETVSTDKEDRQKPEIVSGLDRFLQNWVKDAGSSGRTTQKPGTKSPNDKFAGSSGRTTKKIGTKSPNDQFAGSSGRTTKKPGKDDLKGEIRQRPDDTDNWSSIGAMLNSLNVKGGNNQRPKEPFRGGPPGEMLDSFNIKGGISQRPDETGEWGSARPMLNSLNAKGGIRQRPNEPFRGGPPGTKLDSFNIKGGNRMRPDGVSGSSDNAMLKSINP